jgi:hypothetical protein
VNDDSLGVPFSVAASVLSRSSGAKSRQPEPSENPDPGSLAGSPDPSPSTSTTPTDESDPLTSPDPLWTDEDRNLLLALLAEEREECEGCGWPLEISTDPKTQRTWTVHRTTCEACRILAVEVSNDAESKRPHRGVKYAVIRDG